MHKFSQEAMAVDSKELFLVIVQNAVVSTSPTLPYVQCVSLERNKQ